MEPKFVLGSIRTEVPREFPKSKQPNRLFGLEHYEFKEPMKYFESIGPRLKQFGIGKIVPPSGWKPPFVLDTDQFKFKTRLQRLNSMEASARANLNFLEQLYLFHKQRGSSNFIDSTPKSRREINDMGGYDHITSQRKWDRSPADSLSPLSSSLADHDEANRVAGSKEVKPGDNLKRTKIRG
ncbi:hypothetical protein H4Q26_017641 [Puccinia striiformis f. sp. tritici PST-130]|nr:hypothetical protein H4Q26_017641 [Puccinia striiformis f. sp. tritici PST-130]